MPKSHAPYPESFRADAVALVRRSGKSIAEVAGDLGVSHESLRTWEELTRIDAGEGPPGALSDPAMLASLERFAREVMPRLRDAAEVQTS